MSALLTGELAVMFWVGFVLLALLLPIALDLLHKYKEMEDKTAAWIIGLSAASVIIGGFLLRAVITIGGTVIAQYLKTAKRL